jgi:hypothetical protein
MRRVFMLVLLAFLMSWAAAEWPRTRFREFTGTVDRVDRDRIIVGPWELGLRDTTTIEDNLGAPLAPNEIQKGEPIAVTLRCVPNTVPACLPDRVRVLRDVSLPSSGGR